MSYYRVPFEGYTFGNIARPQTLSGGDRDLSTLYRHAKAECASRDNAHSDSLVRLQQVAGLGTPVERRMRAMAYLGEFASHYPKHPQTLSVLETLAACAHESVKRNEEMAAKEAVMALSVAMRGHALPKRADRNLCEDLASALESVEKRYSPCRSMGFNAAMESVRFYLEQQKHTPR